MDTQNENALELLQERIESKLAIKSMLVNDFYPLTHEDFVVKRVPFHDHVYNVVRKSDSKWITCKFEQNRIVAVKRGTLAIPSVSAHT